jgi:hypothetical protein
MGCSVASEAHVPVPRWISLSATARIGHETKGVDHAEHETRMKSAHQRQDESDQASTPPGKAASGDPSMHRPAQEWSSFRLLRQAGLDCGSAQRGMLPAIGMAISSYHGPGSSSTRQRDTAGRTGRRRIPKRWPRHAARRPRDPNRALKTQNRPRDVSTSAGIGPFLLLSKTLFTRLD